MVLAVFGIAYVLLVPSLAAALAITVVGLFVPAALILGGRGWGFIWRGLGNGLLGTHVPEPPKFQSPMGFWRTFGAMLGDVTGWRALAFTLIAFPLALIFIVISTVFLGTGLAGLTVWIWGRFLPLEYLPTAACLPQGSPLTLAACPQVRPFVRWGRWGFFIDANGAAQMSGTPGYLDANNITHLLIAALIGLSLLLLWPLITHAFANLFRVLTSALLGPSNTELRVAKAYRSLWKP
jgi:hypothetical protein